MRLRFVGSTLALAILMSVPAEACKDPASSDSAYAPATLGGAEVVPVDRGEDLAIQCEGIGSPGAQVNVVMKLDPVVGESDTGFKQVLLTDESVGATSVHVRVPDIADLVNHTVTLKVYVVGANGTTACNAGHLRIV